jgi:hypothetical protein
MTTIVSEYGIRQKVLIKELGIPAVVVDIKLSSTNPSEYVVNVEYWWEG